MQPGILRQIFFLGLSIVFSIALMFAFIELPHWIESLLQEKIGFPGFDHGMSETNAYLSNVYIDALYLRWIGYLSLALIILFILIGFITRKSGWAWAGAFAIFLPVFGQFALSMFFLSGLGILRAGWLPFIDISWNILELGNVIYIPYWILLWVFRIFDLYAHDIIAWMFMSIGSLLFVWGVMEWFHARFGQKGVAVRSIYRVSRHPQYLGWIIWSYGFMLFPMYLNNMKKTWGMPSSLPWLLMTMIIIAICLMEEIKMKKEYGEAYEQYRLRTPFLFPLPGWLKKLIRLPARILIRKKSPENGWDIFKITTVYTIALILISTIWVDYNGKDSNTRPTVLDKPIPADSILAEIQVPDQGRKEYHRHILYIRKYGDRSIPMLISLLENPIPEIREFSAGALGDYRANESVTSLINLISDPVSRVRSAAIDALGKIGSPASILPLLSALENPEYEGYRYKIYGALVNMNAKEVKPYLIQGLSQPPWYQQNSAMRALYKLDPDTAIPYIIRMLKDEDHHVRREAVILLLQAPPKESLESFKALTADEDFEIRFYARQAIKKIEADKMVE